MTHNISSQNTIAARISPLDDRYTRQSPRKGCKYESIYKSICVPVCKRIKSYRAGEDWTQFPVPKLSEFPKNSINSINSIMNIKKEKASWKVERIIHS